MPVVPVTEIAVHLDDIAEGIAGDLEDGLEVFERAAGLRFDALGVLLSASSAFSGASERSRAKKDRARRRAGSPGYREAPRGLVRGQVDLDPERLVFIDETWASTVEVSI